MMQKPLAEITLRKYEKPFRLSGRELVAKLCLSLGLLQPGDSRDVIVDVLYSIVHSKEPLHASEVEKSAMKSRKKHKLSLTGCASSNIRRQLKRLRDSLIVERIGMCYRLSEGSSLSEIFSDRIAKFYLPEIVSRVQEYCDAVHKEVEDGKNVP